MNKLQALPSIYVAWSLSGNDNTYELATVSLDPSSRKKESVSSPSFSKQMFVMLIHGLSRIFTIIFIFVSDLYTYSASRILTDSLLIPNFLAVIPTRFLKIVEKF